MSIQNVIAQTYLDAEGDLQVTLVENGEFCIREIGRSPTDPSVAVMLDSNHALVLLDFLLDHRHTLHKLSQGTTPPEPSPLQQWIAEQQQQGKLPGTELVSLDGGTVVKDGLIHTGGGIYSPKSIMDDEHRDLRERMKLWNPDSQD